MGKKLKLSSPIMDMNIKTVWKTFSMLEDSSYSKLYDKYYEAGVPLNRQRTASLLHTCAINGISVLRSLEPVLYDKINNRFNNINFLKEHGSAYYYNIQKPDFKKWNGEKGTNNEFIRDIFTKYGFNINENENHFEISKNEKIIKYPIDYLLKEFDLDDNERDILIKINSIPISWRDYCIYLIDGLSENVKKIFQEKIISFILGWKYVEYIIKEKTLDALMILVDVDNEILQKVILETWNKDDFYVQIHKNQIHLSLFHCPNESIEKEAADVLEYLYQNNLLKKYYEKSETIKKIVDSYSKNGEFDIASLRRKDFHEDVHSTENWKIFAICILKNDVHMTYANGVITYETTKLKDNVKNRFK